MEQSAPTATNLRYSDRVRVIEQSILRLKDAQDVEDAVRVYEESHAHIQACQRMIDEAKRKVTLLTTDGEHLVQKDAPAHSQ